MSYSYDVFHNLGIKLNISGAFDEISQTPTFIFFITFPFPKSKRSSLRKIFNNLSKLPKFIDVNKNASSGSISLQ